MLTGLYTLSEAGKEKDPEGSRSKMRLDYDREKGGAQTFTMVAQFSNQAIIVSMKLGQEGGMSCLPTHWTLRWALLSKWITLYSQKPDGRRDKANIARLTLYVGVRDKDGKRKLHHNWSKLNESLCEKGQVTITQKTVAGMEAR